MGADLITFIAVGPELIQLTPAKRKKVLAKMKARIKECEKWKEKGGKLPKGMMDEIDVENVADMEMKDVAKVLDEVIGLWNGSISTRDSNSRLFKHGGKWGKVMVAGDMSWGDSPDGEGYRILREAEMLGINDLIGLR